MLSLSGYDNMNGLSPLPLRLLGAHSHWPARGPLETAPQGPGPRCALRGCVELSEP